MFPEIFTHLGILVAVSVGVTTAGAALAFPTAFGEGGRALLLRAMGVGLGLVLVALPFSLRDSHRRSVSAADVAAKAEAEAELNARSQLQLRELDHLREQLESAFEKLPSVLSELKAEKAPREWDSFQIELSQVVEEAHVDGASSVVTTRLRGTSRPSRAQKLIAHTFGGGLVSAEPTVRLVSASGLNVEELQFAVSGRKVRLPTGRTHYWWDAVVETPATYDVEVGEIVEVAIEERSETQDDTSVVWFDPRSYPPSLRKYEVCIALSRPLFASALFEWDGSQLLPARDASTALKLRQSAPEPGAEKRVCVSSEGEAPPAFICMFTQAPDLAIADAGGIRD